MKNKSQTVIGYLPNDTPPLGQTLLLGIQHALTMFPATVLVALLVGFHTSTVLFASGLATIVALLGSKWKLGKFIPLYYGSSFSYIAAILAVTKAEFGQPANDELIRVAQAGIMTTGLINILIGYVIRKAGGKEALDKILPPIITGSVAAVIGLALGFTALEMAGGGCCGQSGNSTWYIVSGVTLLSTIIYSVYLQGRGFISMLPILFGAITGYLISIPLGLVSFDTITTAPFITTPHLTLPDFTSSMTATAVISIAIMAIATIPESTAHLYQISLYVDNLAQKKKQKPYQLKKFVGFNLMLDGIGDFINGLFGGAAGTNYGENNSLMVITKNYSGVSLIAAGLIAIALSFSGTLAAVIQSIPTAVSGGLAIYLFGVIGMQGIALLMTEKVNLFDPKQLAIGAAIMTIGIGGHIGYPGGFIPLPYLTSIFPNGWPAITTAAVVGIALNLLFTVVKPPIQDTEPSSAT